MPSRSMSSMRSLGLLGRNPSSSRCTRSSAVSTPSKRPLGPMNRSPAIQHAASRKSAGVVATHINRDAAQPNLLSVYIAGSDAAKLAGLLTSQDLMTTMRNAGVKGPPRIAKITPVEDNTRKDALAGLIVRHQVADYAAWKRAFD